MLEPKKSRVVRRQGPIGRLLRQLGASEGSFSLDRARSLSELGGDSKGAIFVEYVALLLLVSVGGAAAVVALGAPLVALARFAQLVVGLPIP